ncbi:MAG: hypothetical protein Q7K43_03540, partial [Candidatus Woesearchaeota archaeon]|nr:hypothetical protein [Candidatus Woesearchaeota archaeon]
MKTALLIAAAILLHTSYASGLEYPVLQTGKRVYTQPADWQPDGFSQAKIAELESVSAQLKHPFYVVLFKELDCNQRAGDRVPQEKCASDAIDAIAVRFQQYDFYDVATSSIFILSYNPRQYRFLAGARWKSELRFERAAHAPYTRLFENSVKGTPKDPQGGIIAMMKAVDTYLVDATDPIKIAARQEARKEEMRLRSQQQARASLDAVSFRLDDLLHEGEFLPDDNQKYITLLQKAKDVRA